MRPGPQFDPLFHGTSTERPVGGVVLPPSLHNGPTPNSPYAGYREPDHDQFNHASASSAERTAWEFAGMTAQRRGGRSQVLKVDRPVDAKKGLEKKEVLSGTGFPVRDVEHIRPPEEIRKPGTFMSYYPNPRGRQGTLPVDFSGVEEHRDGSVYPLGDARGNHPTERDRRGESKRIESQEAARQPVVPKSKPGPKQPMLPGMRGAVTRGRAR